MGSSQDLLLFLIAIVVVSFVVWRSKQGKRASQSSDARRASEAAGQTASDQAFAIDVATGAMGGSAKDAAIVKFALDRVKEDGHQPDARDRICARRREGDFPESVRSDLTNRSSQPLVVAMIRPQHFYEVRPPKINTALI
jgi:hypothetical protein